MKYAGRSNLKLQAIYGAAYRSSLCTYLKLRHVVVALLVVGGVHDNLVENLV